MRTQQLDLDEHACLWPDLTIHARHVEGPEDIVVATHPQLGTCVVSHRGFSPLITWMTHQAIPDELTNFEVIEKPALVFTPFEAAFVQLVEMIASDATASPA